MKRSFCWFAAFLAAVLSAIVPASAAGQTPSELRAAADSVSISYYNSTKIVSGFTEGETLGGAANMFVEPERIEFVSLSTRRIISDPDAAVFTGAVLCVTEDSNVTDMGVMAVFGDVNGDGRVTSADARLALIHASGREKLGAVPAVAADCDCSGRVTSADARVILRDAARLEKIANPIGRVSAQSVPVDIYAYYTGDDPEAGTVISRNAVKVIAVYSDARNAVVDEGYTVTPSALTADAPGKKTFTVTWQGLQADFTVNFAPRTPVSYYADSKVPDYKGVVGVSAVDVEHYIGYIAYIYPALDEATDFIRFGSYRNYLTQCGFVCVGTRSDSERIIAAYSKPDDQAQAVLIYDFSGQRIYVAVYK